VSASDCARFLTDELGVSSDRIAVIPQAAPDAYLEKPAAPMTRARAKRLLHVGQYAFIKAPMVVAEAVNGLVERDEEITVTWITETSAHPQVSRLLSEKARSRTILRGWMPQHELIDVYDSHGIFLFASFCEGFGKVFVEAMARGLCVIAAEAGGVKDVIRDREDGIVVPIGDAAAMMDACHRVLESEGAVRALGERAAVRAREYSWRRVAEETMAFYARRLARSEPTEAD
jgi:glycosyltransferase involved in cell wall biosynthesis